MYKGGDRELSAGFTIVEVMIVLAVSSALLVSAAVLISGRQAKTEFQTGINNVQQQVQQIINEATSGYYPNNGGFSCIGSTNNQVVGFTEENVNASQGSNAGCIFLGKAIQFGLTGSDGDESTLGVLPLVGNQNYTPPLASDPAPILNLSQALPRALYPASTEIALRPPTSAVTKELMDYGLYVADHNNACTSNTSQQMCYVVSGSTTQTGLVAITAGASNGDITAKNGNGGGLQSGSEQFSLYGVKTSKPDESFGNASGAIGNYDNASPNGLGNLVPASAIYICIASASTNQSGLLTIQSGSLNVKLDIKVGLQC